jgi:hypothetical protein
MHPAGAPVWVKKDICIRIVRIELEQRAMPREMN